MGESPNCCEADKGNGEVRKKFAHHSFPIWTYVKMSRSLCGPPNPRARSNKAPSSPQDGQKRRIFCPRSTNAMKGTRASWKAASATPRRNSRRANCDLRKKTEIKLRANWGHECEQPSRSRESPEGDGEDGRAHPGAVISCHRRLPEGPNSLLAARLTAWHYRPTIRKSRSLKRLFAEIPDA